METPIQSCELVVVDFYSVKKLILEQTLPFECSDKSRMFSQIAT